MKLLQRLRLALRTLNREERHKIAAMDYLSSLKTVATFREKNGVYEFVPDVHASQLLSANDRVFNKHFFVDDVH